MANIKSQIKRNRQNAKRNLANRRLRSEISTRTNAAMSALDEGSDLAHQAVSETVKRIDKAAKKGVLHPNTAARKKSRLAKRLAESRR